MVVDNADGLTVRTDFNAAVQALATCSSGNVEPASPWPGMLWLDLTVAPNGVLRQRDQANTLWLPVLLPPEFRFTQADLSLQARTSPNRFAINDKADGSGTDIFTVREDGLVTLAGAGFAPVSGADVPTKSYVDSTVVPVGAVMYFGMQTPPTNWLKANGASLIRTDFPALFAAIGTAFGAVDSSHFTVPELRGEFIRGFDDGRNVDTGRVFGAWQADAFASHTHPASTGINSVGHTHTFSDSASDTSTAAGAHSHTYNQLVGGSGIPAGAGGFQTTSGATSSVAAHTHSVTISVSGTTSAQSANHTHTVTVSPVGAADTRPRNVAMLACIKYQ
jgi:microcystin-dependent protein